MGTGGGAYSSDTSMRNAVISRLIRHNLSWFTTMAIYQALEEPLSGLGISVRL